MIRTFFLLLLLSAAAPSRTDAASQIVRCPVTKDVWLSLGNREESDTNGGKSPTIKLKVLQEFGLLDFDVKPLLGKKIIKATFCVHPEGGSRFAPAERGSDLRWFTVSTVSSPWEEGLGEQYAKDVEGRGATFNEASYRSRPWTVPGSKCWDVIVGNGNSLRDDVDAGEPKEGWFRIPLKSEILAALIAESSYGLCLMDGSTGIDRNSRISSREGSHPPFLEVEIDGASELAPEAPKLISAAASPAHADAGEGALEISLVPGRGTFAWQIEQDGKPLPRWQIPFPPANLARHHFFLEHLAPNTQVKLTITPVSSIGRAGPQIEFSARTSPGIAVPKPPASPWNPSETAAAPDPSGEVTTWAFPEGLKLDPIKAQITIEPGWEQASRRNAVWAGAQRTVRVAAAQGEIASVQFAIALVDPASPRQVQPVLKMGGGVTTRLWRAWFVHYKEHWQQEYALPLGTTDTIQLPADDNKIPGQRAGVLAVDFIVPQAIVPGVYQGVLSFASPSAGLVGGDVKIELQVYPAAIPSLVHFNPELNSYTGPEAGSSAFFAAHRLAHYHRASINRVTHSHSGRTSEDATPVVDATGHVIDWSKYDQRWGPLLDGTAFSDNPRPDAPVACLYLPQNENWPLMMKPHYAPGVSTAGPNWKAIHDLEAKPPEEAFDADYKSAMVRNVTDFVAHFEEKRWNRTRMEFFQNNKHQYGKDGMAGTAWMMDEPNEYLDWCALTFYSRLFHQGLAAAKSVQFGYRGDISRPMWQGSLMDGWMEILYANSEQFQMPGVMRGLTERSPMTLICYGGCNPPDRSNIETVAWCLKSYLHGCDGVVPWQSLGDDSAFDRGDKEGDGNALIVDAQRRFNLPYVASFRVFALRQGAQLAELLRLLELKKGWSRRYSAAFVAQTTPLDAEWRQSFADDAAALEFSKVSAAQMVALKEAILIELSNSR